MPPGPRKPATLLAPLPFLALPCWPHPCSLLAEPERSPGRAEIQGPYLPGGVQHTVPHLGSAVGLPVLQRQGALCPAHGEDVGAACCQKRPGARASRAVEGWPKRPVKTCHLFIASCLFFMCSFIQ